MYSRPYSYYNYPYLHYVPFGVMVDAIDFSIASAVDSNFRTRISCSLSEGNWEHGGYRIKRRKDFSLSQRSGVSFLIGRTVSCALAFVSCEIHKSGCFEKPDPMSDCSERTHTHTPRPRRNGTPYTQQLRHDGIA